MRADHRIERTLDRFRGPLDAITTLVMIGASAALIYAALSIRTNTAAQLPSQIYEVGDSFGELPGVRFSDSKTTLVMFVRSGCKFCTASAPFYQKLLATPSRTRVIAVGYEETTALRDYLGSLQVQPDAIVKALPGMIRLTGTPTLVLVSALGKVERVWRGQLDLDDERSVIESARR